VCSSIEGLSTLNQAYNSAIKESGVDNKTCYQYFFSDGWSNKLKVVQVVVRRFFDLVAASETYRVATRP
jgi:hypothetical protein